MHQALYRKWRPQRFDDVYGQEHITSILRYETEAQKFSHAYLFCGSRGTGKTTCAKILAKAVNCEHPVNGSPCNECAACRSIDAGTATDVLEMDAASNNGVENIRDIRDEVVYSPSVLRYRVYIVDEVHMLSGSAFNALLKTLEEPPAHVVFVLATTELHKLPATIVSRCQRFDFRRIATSVLMERLELIAREEGIEADEDALRTLARLAQGGMRDAISLLELCASNRQRITVELVNATVGSTGREQVVRLTRAIAESDFDTVFEIVNDVVVSSKDIAVFWQELISYYRDMLVFRTTSRAEQYLDLTDSEAESLRASVVLFTRETLLLHCRMLDEALSTMQRAGAAKRVVAEMTLVKMTDRTLEPTYDALLSRVSRLETAMASGQRLATPVASAKEDEKPKQEQTASKETKQAPAQASDQVKPIRGWSEIMENITGVDAFAMSFLKMGRGVVRGDGVVVIRFANAFQIQMVDQPGLRDALRAALCVHLQREIADRDLIFEESADGDDSATDLDELIQ